VTTWLHEQRIEAVLAAVLDSGAETVLDLGCGDGALLTQLVGQPSIRRIVGMDVSAEALNRLRQRLESAPAAMRRKVELVHGSFTDTGTALSGFDAAVLLETIEHIDPARLSVLERAVFGEMRPGTVLITTPNSDFNPLLGVPAHRLRHPDHRFEWGRARFRSWADGVAGRNGYTVVCREVAGAHPIKGGASQMALFERKMGRRGSDRSDLKSRPLSDRDAARPATLRPGI
jgi:small RNA 2'-O-methyltransferase